MHYRNYRVHTPSGWPSLFHRYPPVLYSTRYPKIIWAHFRSSQSGQARPGQNYWALWTSTSTKKVSFCVQRGGAQVRESVEGFLTVLLFFDVVVMREAVSRFLQPLADDQGQRKRGSSQDRYGSESLKRKERKKLFESRIHLVSFRRCI